MNLIEKFKSLPVKNKQLLSIAIIAALTLALPLFIWGVVTQRFNIGNRASSGEPGVCIPENKIITVSPPGTDGYCHDLQTAVNAVNQEGMTIKVLPGTYQIDSTIRIANKNKLVISGYSGSDVNNVIFNSVAGGGWGILIENSSGQIDWITMVGGSSNGMLSIQNSHDFDVRYVSLNSQSSHTMDVQGSQRINIFNSDIQSSAGALEIGSSDTINVAGNRIHNAANGFVAYNSNNITLINNLISDNTESGIVLQNVANFAIKWNTIVNNALTSSTLPAVVFRDTELVSGEIKNNIIAHNRGGGIYTNVQNLSLLLERNDVWNSGQNYSGLIDSTGVNGNISADPNLNTNPGANYCLFDGSPAIYGDSAQQEYMGHIGPCSLASTPTPTPYGSAQPSATPFPTSSASPGSTPPPTVRPFEIRLKFDGVSADAANFANVTVRLISRVLDASSGYITSPLPVIYEGNGVYRLNFGIWSNDLPSGSDYALIVKGEKHLGVKFCFTSGQSTHCPGSSSGNIVIPVNPLQKVNLDFTGIPLPAGDARPQDGVVDINDWNRVKTIVNKFCHDQTGEEISIGDLNYDGCVDIKDLFLIRKTLQTRYDES